MADPPPGVSIGVPVVPPAPKPTWMVTSARYAYGTGGNEKEAKTLAPGEDSDVSLRWMVSVSSGQLDDLHPSVAGMLRVRDRTGRNVFSARLSRDQVREGAYPWRGEVNIAHGDDEPYPDGFVTHEFSPYAIELEVLGQDADEAHQEKQTVSVEVKVAVRFTADATLAPGDAPAPNAELVKRVAAAMAAGEHVELALASPNFAKSIFAMYAADTTVHDANAAVWSAGPKVPLVVEPLFTNARGAKVPAPKAWGAFRVRWKLEYPPAPAMAGWPERQALLDHLQRAWKAAGPGASHNAHTDFGGKRDAQGGAEVSELTGAPFAWDDREALTFTTGPAAAGKLRGRSGVLFSPSRLAGDRYRITAEFAKPKSSGTWSGRHSFEVLRDVRVAKHLQKTKAMKSFALDGIFGDFARASVKLTPPKTQGLIPKEPYNSVYKQGIKDLKIEELMKLMIAPKWFDDPHGDKPYAMRFRPIKAFLARLKTDAAQSLAEASPPKLSDDERKVVAALQAQPFDDDDDDSHRDPENQGTNFLKWKALFDGLSQATQTEIKPLVHTRMVGLGIADAASYYKKANDTAVTLTSVAVQRLCVDDGVTVAHFTAATSLGPDMDFYTKVLDGLMLTKGLAINFEEKKCGLMLLAEADDPRAGVFAIHEVGHVLCLAHARSRDGGGAAGPDIYAHTQAGSGGINCLMAYDAYDHRSFCAYCVVRIRGWRFAEIQRWRKEGTTGRPADNVPVGRALDLIA